MDNKEIKQKLKDSLDMVYVRLWCIVYIGLLLVGLALCLLHPTLRQMPGILLGTVGVATLPGLVYLIPALKIWFSIYREIPAYRLYKATLAQPHGGFPRGFMYFTVVLEDPDGGKFLANTNTIFQSYGTAFGPSMEDYVNQTVTIAYNEDTGTAVVLG